MTAVLLLLIATLAQIQVAGGPNQQPAAPGTGSVEGAVENEVTQAPVTRAMVGLNGPLSLSAVTDASGRFAFRALPEGSYSLSVHKEGFQAASDDGFVPQQQVPVKTGEQKRGIRLPLLPGGEVSGRIVNEREQPIGNCFITLLKKEWRSGQTVMEQRSSAQVRANGEYTMAGVPAGRYYARAQCGQSFIAAHRFLPAGDPATPQEVYRPMFYGGTSLESAQQFAVAGGSPLSGVDFTIPRIHSIIISGTLTTTDAEMPGTGIYLQLIPRDSSVSTLGAYGAMVNPGNHTFLIQPVIPGAYRLFGTVGSGDRVWFADQEIEAGAEPIEGLRLTLTRGFDLKGTAEMADGSPLPGGIQISLQSAGQSGPGERNITQPVDDKGFQFASLIPGKYRLLCFAPNTYIQSVAVDGQEMDRADLRLSGGMGSVRIVLGTRTAKLDVAVEGKEPETQVSVIALSEAQMESGITDQVSSNIGDQRGAVTIAGLRPGKYFVFALETLNPWVLLGQPAVMKSLANRAVAVDLAEDAKASTTVHIIRAAEIRKAREEQQ